MKSPRLLSDWMRVLALLAHAALILGLVLGSGSRLAWLAALPLLLPIPGLLRGRRYTYGWASMMLTGYCAVLLSNAYSQPDARGLMFTLATFAAIEFSALVLFARFSAREAAALQRR